MDFGTVVGLLIGAVAMVIPMSLGGQLRGFADPVSAVLVLGGAIAATMVNFPLSQIRQALSNLRDVFQVNTQSPVEISDLIVDLSEQARRKGVLSLEGRVAEMPTDLLRHGLQRVVDGAMPDMVKQQLEVELDLLDEKTSKSKAVFDAMAAYSPAFGMIGTIVGLINMLLTMKDPSTLGASMGLALVTTFYGAVMANLVFLPIAGKLRARSDEQLLLGQMVIQGLVSIASGENPSAVRDMMAVFTGVVGVNDATLDDTDYIKAGAV